MLSMRTFTAFRLASLFALTVGAGCDGPEVDAVYYSCNSQNDCGSGYECRFDVPGASGGVCLPVGHVVGADVSSDASGQPDVADTTEPMDLKEPADTIVPADTTGPTDTTDTNDSSTQSDTTVVPDTTAPSDVVVTYDVNGGSACSGASTASVTPGDNYGASPCTTTRAGYDFGGWWTSASGGVEIFASTEVTVTSDHTLYARWELPPPAGFVRIIPGTFTMGSPSNEVGRSSHEAQVSVTLTRRFLMGETEVTQGQWKALSGGVNPSSFTACGDTCPVEQVSWWSVFGYANALSAAEELVPCFTLPTSGCTGTWQAGTLDCGDQMPTVTGGNVYACEGYRLPTEAEWEYAARAGTTTATYGGNLSGTSGCVTLSGAGSFSNGTSLADLGWYECNDSPNGTEAVKGKAPNAWGLYDMLGNVWEWTWDRYDASLPGGTDPQRTASGAGRVRRGGCWVNAAGYLRAAGRFDVTPGNRYDVIGFRLTRSVP